VLSWSPLTGAPASAALSGAAPSSTQWDTKEYPSLKGTDDWTIAKITSIVVPIALFVGVVIAFCVLYGKRRRLLQEERKRTDQLWSARGGGGAAGGAGLERKESTDSLIAYVEKRESTLQGPRPRFGGSVMSFASSMDSLAVDDRRDSRYRPQSFTPSPSSSDRNDPFAEHRVASEPDLTRTPGSDYTLGTHDGSPPSQHASPLKQQQA
jgi:hypothetical protein